MRILRDIKCSIDNIDLVGRIVIQDDNRYEGIMLDINTKKKYLVMGVISNNSLEFIALHKKSKDPVYFMETSITNKKYIGDVYRINDNHKELIGNGSIRIFDPNYYRDVNDGEIISVLAKTRILKSEIAELKKDTKEKQLLKRKVHK